jgi:hypothetical protein
MNPLKIMLGGMSKSMASSSSESDMYMSQGLRILNEGDDIAGPVLLAREANSETR